MYDLCVAVLLVQVGATFDGPRLTDGFARIEKRASNVRSQKDDDARDEVREAFGDHRLRARVRDFGRTNAVIPLSKRWCLAACLPCNLNVRSQPKKGAARRSNRRTIDFLQTQLMNTILLVIGKRDGFLRDFVVGVPERTHRGRGGDDVDYDEWTNASPPPPPPTTTPTVASPLHRRSRSITMRARRAMHLQATP